MTVRELIAELKKMPQSTKVGWQDHDHGESDLNAEVGCVERADSKAIENETGYKGIGVVLRP